VKANNPSGDSNDPSGIPTVIQPASSSTPFADVRIEFGSRTDLGKARPNNEDQFLIARMSKALDILATSVPADNGPELLWREGYFFLVADGMGGAAAGEHASAVVVHETVKHLLETARWFYRLDAPDETERIRLLREALERADQKLIAEAEADPSLTGMGTTLTALSIVGGDAFLVHVGDSRAYLFREGGLEQLTRDHTLAQQWIDQGMLRPEEARTHRLRHVLTNVIGGRPGVEGEIVKLRLQDRDRILLCTDGLNEPVSDERIAEILGRAGNPQEACDALVEAALEGGGRDNITVVLADCSFQAAAPLTGPKV
jgi:PPM family protein phosphatase